MTRDVGAGKGFGSLDDENEGVNAGVFDTVPMMAVLLMDMSEVGVVERVVEIRAT